MLTYGRGLRWFIERDDVGGLSNGRVYDATNLLAANPATYVDTVTALMVRPHDVILWVCHCQYHCHVLEPVRLGILRSNSKFNQISSALVSRCTLPITTKFFTRHGIVTVVTCAKFRCDRYTILSTRALQIVIEFRIRSKYRTGALSLVETAIPYVCLCMPPRLILHEDEIPRNPFRFASPFCWWLIRYISVCYYCVVWNHRRPSITGLLCGESINGQ